MPSRGSFLKCEDLLTLFHPMHLRRELVAFGATSHQAASSDQWWLWLTKMLLGCCCQECYFFSGTICSDPGDHLGLKMGTPQSPEMGSSQLGQLIRNEQSVSNLTISCPEGEYIFIYSYSVAHRKEKMKRLRQTQGKETCSRKGGCASGALHANWPEVNGSEPWNELLIFTFVGLEPRTIALSFWRFLGKYDLEPSIVLCGLGTRDVRVWLVTGCNRIKNTGIVHFVGGN